MLAPRLTVQGPIPKFMPILADALRRQGCEVELFAWGRRSDHERLPSKLFGRAWDVLSARRGINRGGFRVVVVNTSHDWLTMSRDLALLRALRRRDRVTIVQFHGSQSPRLLSTGSSPFKRATRALLDSADGVLVLSRDEQAELLTFSPSSRVFVVRNPLTVSVDDVPRAGARGGIATILCVARLMPGKGVFELVRALPLVRRTMPCRLVIAGEGGAKDELMELAVELGVGAFVELPGYVGSAQLADLYRDADVFALPTSYYEGFPTVILEAMAAGLPVVTTPWRGPVDHLVDGRHALFVPPHDHEALAAVLTRLLQDDDLRRSMGSANLHKAREFEPDPVAKEYLEAIDSIVAAASRGENALV